MTYTHTCPNCSTEIPGEFTPERPAPVCSNHDSPLFSDPGDGADWDGPEECPECGEPINLDEVLDAASEYFDSAACPDADRNEDF